MPPGYVRRFSRKLEKMNKDFYYYENSEGGHAGASDHEQYAFLIALRYTYLYQQLFDKK